MHNLLICALTTVTIDTFLIARIRRAAWMHRPVADVPMNLDDDHDANCLTVTDQIPIFAASPRSFATGRQSRRGGASIGGAAINIFNDLHAWFQHLHPPLPVRVFG